ncbi:PAS domain S-box protein [Candidatus Gracilibacteria bacterium]|nr:PAS domain S-box protein [Candidatus Gracilibacteria bacterium]
MTTSENLSDELRRQVAMPLDDAARAQIEQAMTQLEAMLNSLPLGLAFFDRELRYVRVNAELARLHNRPAEAHIGQTLEAVLPQVAATLRPYIEQVFATGIGIHDIEISTPRASDPSKIAHTLASWYPVKVDNDTVLVGAVVQDITARKRAEAALARSEQRFRRVVDSRPVGVLFADMVGRISDANQSLLDLLGYEREMLIGTPWATLTPPEYAEADAQATAELLSTGSVAPYAKEYLRSDGSRVPVLVGATMLQTDPAAGGFEAVAFVIDNSARNQAEMALRQSEQRFRALSDAGVLGVIIADATGRIVEANAAFLQLIGLSDADLRDGVTWQDLTPSEGTALDNERNALLKRQGAVPAYEKEFLRRDGSRVTVLVGAALTDATLALAWVLCLILARVSAPKNGCNGCRLSLHASPRPSRLPRCARGWWRN